MNKLKSARLRLGLNQTQMAKLMGWKHQQSVQRIEVGRQGISEELSIKIDRVLDRELRKEFNGRAKAIIDKSCLTALSFGLGAISTAKQNIVDAGLEWTEKHETYCLLRMGKLTEETKVRYHESK